MPQGTPKGVEHLRDLAHRQQRRPAVGPGRREVQDDTHRRQPGASRVAAQHAVVVDVVHPEAGLLRASTAVGIHEEGGDPLARGGIAEAEEADGVVPKRPLRLPVRGHGLHAEEPPQQPEDALQNIRETEELSHVGLAKTKPLLDQALPPIRDVEVVDIVLLAARPRRRPQLAELPPCRREALAAQAAEERVGLHLRGHLQLEGHVGVAGVPD
mmetsp:Transcript_85675/g.215844  ORF Transcript_85675/g.215844 Transcript_85675/m.215844 type:complete len:213 (+) Transcript_85675:109-747(+)